MSLIVAILCGCRLKPDSLVYVLAAFPDIKASSIDADLLKVEPVGRNKLALIIKQGNAYTGIPIYLWFDSFRQLEDANCELKGSLYLCNQNWVIELESQKTGKIFKNPGEEFLLMNGRKVHLVPKELARFNSE